MDRVRRFILLHDKRHPGIGMRLLEWLRVQDVEFTRREIIVR